MTFFSNQHLVFMPGLDGTGKSIEPVLPLIAADNRVSIIRYPDDQTLSFEETVQCAARQIPGNPPPVVIAESFSGPVAVRMIASGLVKARALVLCATFARSPHPVAWRIMRLMGAPLLLGPNMPKFFLKRIMGGAERMAALLPLWEKVHAAVPKRIMASRLSLINRLDVTEDLRKITIPCLYLQAEDDRVVPSKCLRDFEQNIPHLFVKTIQAPHFILQAEPRACLAAIDEFLQWSDSAIPGDTIDSLKSQIAYLKKSEAFFRAITQDSADMVIVVNAKAVITYVNPAVEKILGYKLEEVIGKSGFDYIIADEIPRALRDFGKAILTRDIKIPNAFKIRHKDGSARILEGIGINLLNNPIVQGFVINVRDITLRRQIEEELQASRKQLESLVEKRTAALSMTNAQLSGELEQRKNAEKALLESEEKYRDFIDHVPIGVGAIDTEGRVLYINKRIEELMGWSREDIVGRDGFGLEAFDDQTRKLLLSKFAQRTKDKTRYVFEIPVTTKGGNRLWVEVVATPLKKDGKTVGAQIVFVNLEERKRAEEERQAQAERLHRIEKMQSIGTLAGGVAHELNNILGVLVGYTELLMMKMPDDDPLKKHLQNMMKSGESAAAIIQDMQILSGRGVSVSEVLNLNTLIGEFLRTPEFERIRSSHPRVVFNKKLSEQLLNIQGSPSYLGKTVRNLIANAFEAVSREGAVTVGTGNCYLNNPLPGYNDVREGDYVMLTVRDNGPGISTDNLHKIFEPFYTKKVMGKSGTGLGLAVVWGAVRDHLGYIDVQTQPGQGSTFTLYLPATHEPLKTHPRSGPLDSYLGHGETILVVDDMPEQRDVAFRLLTRLGYSVQTAASGKAAIAYLKDYSASLLILDMLMEPGIDGLETYQRIQEIKPGQKAIIVSGYTETDRVQKALDMGVSAFVHKPYLIEDIGTAIRKALSEK